MIYRLSSALLSTTARRRAWPLVALFLLAGPALAQELTPEIAARVRADIAARGLPLVDQPTAAEAQPTTTSEGMVAPDGERLAVIAPVTELGARGVALVATASGRYWTLARPANGSAVMNGPYPWRAQPAEAQPAETKPAESKPVAPAATPTWGVEATDDAVAAALAELGAPQSPDGERRHALVDGLLVSPASWGRVDAALATLASGDAAAAERARREISGEVRQEIRLALATEAGGGFYDNQFARLARYGAVGEQALIRLLADSAEELEVRTYAAQALGEIGNAETAKNLKAGLERRRLPARLVEAVALALGRLGDRSIIDSMIAGYRDQITKTPDQPNGYFALAQVYVRLGDREEAMRLYRSYLEKDSTSSTAGVTHYNIACVLALSGRADEAFAELDQAAALGGLDFDWMPKDGDLASLHGDPRWQALLAKRPPPEGTRRIF